MATIFPKAIRLKDCTVIFRDGTPTTPNELELKIDDGNIKWDVARNIEVKRDRGNLDYLADGDQEPMKVTLECRFATIKSSTGEDVSPYEFLTKTGNASAFLSTADACAADACDIIVEHNQPCGTAIVDEITTFSDFTYQKISGDFKSGQLSVDGICNAVLPTSVRTAIA